MTDPTEQTDQADPADQNPLVGWTLDRADISFVGHDLQRPECVLAEPDGTLWTADARGGVVRIDPDGDQEVIAQEVVAGLAAGDSADRYVLAGTMPNGLAFAANGDIVIANFGTDAIERMTRAGESTTLLSELDGRPLGKMNFVVTDSRDRIWFTVHTRRDPWLLAVNDQTPDGYVALIDGDDVRVVADGFVGTNEIRFDAAEEWLYVVESNARHVSRLRVLDADAGTLGDREVFGPDDLGGVPDGCAFDAYGNLWVTLIGADRLIAITPQREVLTLLDDGVAELVERFDRHFAAHTMTAEVLMATHGSLAPAMASVTFGGSDLRTVYLGSLAGTTLPSFRSPVAGLAMSHWQRPTTAPG